MERMNLFQDNNKPQIIFYFAECMEFPDYGEYKEFPTLDQAISFFKKYSGTILNTKIHFNNVEDAIDTVMKDTSCRGITDVSELVNKAAESNEAITKPINTSKVVDVSGLFKDDTSSDKLSKLNLF